MEGASLRSKREENKRKRSKGEKRKIKKNMHGGIRGETK